MGTMAFGALILAIVQMIRVMLEYIESKLKGKDNPLVKFLMKYVRWLQSTSTTMSMMSINDVV